MSLRAKLLTFGAAGVLTFGGAALAQNGAGDQGQEGQEASQAQATPAEAASVESLQTALTNLQMEIIELETMVMAGGIEAAQIQLVPIEQISQTQAQPAERAAGAEAERAQEQTVQVSLVDFAIEMPSSLPAGTVSFEVTNNGDTEHNFEIEGQGIEQEFEQNLQPGETQTMTVDLAPGTYEVYCPVGDHREMGMELELTVTEEGQQAQQGQEGQAAGAAGEQAAGAEAERAQAADVETLISQNQQQIDELHQFLQTNAHVLDALNQQNVALDAVVAMDVSETGEVFVFYREQAARMQEQAPQQPPQDEQQDEQQEGQQDEPQDQPQDQPQGEPQDQQDGGAGEDGNGGGGGDGGNY